MISANTLRQQVGAQLSNVTPLSGAALRGERVDASGRPYAVYYFAAPDDLGQWADQLEQKQDELIGPSFFEAPSDLRWNHYLYLVVGADQARGAKFDEFKSRIEGNRSYARKFVVSGDDLPGALKNLQPTPTSGASSPGFGTDVASRWTQRLLDAKLGVVLDQLSIAETIRAIANGHSGSQLSRSDSDRKQRSAQPLATSFLDAVELVRFRAWPRKRMFDSLGTVNLIVGSNGVGKTTFLEAIEYAYCHENARTKSPSGAHVRLRLKDMASWIDRRVPTKVAEAKQRNLDWYGQRDLKGSSLPNSFARFNFLATDEAAMLGRPGLELTFEEMLSRVVAGPQTAELWDHVRRLEAPLLAEAARAAAHLAEAGRRRTVLEALVARTSSAPRPSDTELSSITEDLVRIGWKGDVSRDAVMTSVISALGTAASMAREILNAPLALEVLTAHTVHSALSSQLELLARVGELSEANDELDKKIRHAVDDRARLATVITHIEDIRRAASLGAIALCDALDEIEQRHSTLQKEIGRDSLPTEPPSWIDQSNYPVEEEHVFALAELRHNEKEIARMEAELGAARNQRESMNSMVAQIRTLSKRLVEAHPEHHDCPVCATTFLPGELVSRIASASESVLQSIDRGATLVEAIEIARVVGIHLTDRLKTVRLLQAFASRCGSGFGTLSCSALLKAYWMRGQELIAVEASREQHLSKLVALLDLGVDRNRVDGLRQIAKSFYLDHRDMTGIAAFLDGKNQELSAVVKELEGLELRRQENIKASQSILGGDGLATSTAELLGAARHRRALLQRVANLISELGRNFAFDANEDLGALMPRIDSARAAAEQFSAAVAAERAIEADEMAAKKELTEVGTAIEEQRARKNRLKEAADVISELTRVDSLYDATDAELQSVQGVTADIFQKIHSPHEYGIRRDTVAPLYRLDDVNSAVTLRDVSTGQRAAFVLSVFLAMNAKLKSAPPLLLFDDPVAHIDDFNALSFLDHLRDVAIAGHRQIFYATADSKFAGLFEHKFSFMDEKFRRFDLTR